MHSSKHRLLYTIGINKCEKNEWIEMEYLKY